MSTKRTPKVLDIIRTASRDCRALNNTAASNELLDACAMASDLIDLVKEARKIIRASSARQLSKDWDKRATEALNKMAEASE